MSYEHWKAFEKQFIKHYVQRVSRASNMVVDERFTTGANACSDTSQDKGKATAD